MIGPRALRASGGIAVKGRDGRLDVETVRDAAAIGHGRE